MKPYQALIWNEWRQIRGIVLAAAGATILLWLALLILSMLRIRDIDLTALVISCVLPGLLGCIGFRAFQGEFKDQTDNFLLSLPISRGKVFWYKYFFSLGLYIVLVALCCALFFPLTVDHAISARLATGLISGNPTINLAAMCLAVHAMSVAAPLIQNRRGGKVGGWAVAIAWLALLVGIQAIVALYTCNESRWAGITVFIITAMLWLSALGIGCYLWTNYLVLKRNILRPLIISAGIIVIFSTILFTAAYIYSGLDLAEAKREALAAGLMLETKPAAPPTPEAKNNALRILKSLEQYQLRLNVVKPKLPSQSGINGEKYSWLSVEKGIARVPLATMRQAANFILDDPTAVKMYDDLFQTLNKPFCQLDNSSLTQKIPGSRFFAIDIICHFLNDRACSLELKERTPEAFECLELLDKIHNYVDIFRGFFHDGYRWYKNRNFKFEAASRIGPDTMSGVKYYEKLIRELDSMRPEFVDDTAELLKLLDDRYGIAGKTSQGPLRHFRKIEAFLLTAYHRESIANCLRWQIVYKQLFEQALTAKFAKIVPDTQNLAIRSFRYPSQIQECYNQRYWIVGMKLRLAMKIYKAKHGQSPDTLEKLTPEILPSIPLNPDTDEPLKTGKNFEFRAITGGFSMEIKSLGTTRFFFYNTWETWDKNPVPVFQADSKPMPRGRRSGNTGNHKTIQNKNEERAK